MAQPSFQGTTDGAPASNIDVGMIDSPDESAAETYFFVSALAASRAFLPSAIIW